MELKLVTVAPMITLSSLFLTACTPTELSYTAIRDQPTDLNYAIELCEAEADAVGYSVREAIAAATPDMKGSDAASGFAAGLANGLQGSGEGRRAEKKVFKACMAREGYRVSED